MGGIVKTHEQLIATIHKSINDLARLGLAGVEDERLVEVIADLKALEPRLSTVRKNLETELPDVVTGEKTRTWMASTGNNYSFNNDRILIDTIDKTLGSGGAAFDAFKALIDHGVLRFANQITKVESLYHSLDLPLEIVPHEIEGVGDLDEAHVGKYPKPKARKYEPVDKEVLG